MSDFLKKLKGIFIIEEESAAPKTPATQAPAPAAAPTVAAPPPPVYRPATPHGAVNDRFTEILFNALEKNNQPGFDYFEFRQALQNLANMPLDEPTRFQSAYAMARTMNIDVARLAESARFYLGVLHNEQVKFNEAHAQQRARLIGNREAEVQNLEAAIRQKTEQINQLTLQIEEHRRQSGQIRQEIGESTTKIETTKADFEATFAAVTAQIQSDMQKMATYLK
jgi:uncharacterized protein (DUF3084 family)